MKMTKRMIALAAVALTMSTPLMAQDTSTERYRPLLPLDNVETLCRLKAEDTTAAYRQRASAYGLSQRDLQRLEQNHVCSDGQLLGSIESRWRG